MSERIFQEMLQLDVLRGSHSTGVAFLPENVAQNPLIIKGPVYPQELLEDNQTKAAFRGRITALMGHNRFATKGDINVANSHPFKHGNIIGAHNGTVWNTRRFPKHDFGTDSECIVHSINEIGIKETWKLVDGAAALTFWNLADRSLNIITDSKRAIYYAYNEDHTGLYYASEAWMFAIPCARHDVKLAERAAPNKDVLFTFTYDNGKVSEVAEKIDPFVFPVSQRHHNHGHNGDWGDDQFTVVAMQEYYRKQEIEAAKVHEKNIAANQSGTKPTAVPSGNSHHHGNSRRHSTHGGTFRYPTKAAKKRAKEYRKAERRLAAKGMRSGFNNEQLDQNDFEAAYFNCVFCNDKLKFVDLNTVFLDKHTASCGDCSTFANLHNHSRTA